VLSPRRGARGRGQRGDRPPVGQAIADKARKHGLALELARLDELQEVFYQRATEGGVSCDVLVTKIIERRCTMLALHMPQTAVLQIVDETTPKETSTDRIERVLADLRPRRRTSRPLIERR
jgi:hypothetical protein